MAELFSLDNLLALVMLTLLQAVLGFDNLLYISLESKRAPEERRAFVRRMGIGLAIFLRIALLLLLVRVVGAFQEPLFGVHATGYAEASFSLHSLIVLLGGAFIIYTAMKEIFHMIGVQKLDHGERATKSTGAVIAWIVLMNLVFSFDSILSAMALTEVFWVMACAIVISGILMIWLADHVAEFLERNRMYEVLGLFILFIVGIMLVTEGGHMAHIKLWDHAVMPMSKATFYFVIGVLVITDIVQGRYQRRLLGTKH